MSFYDNAIMGIQLMEVARQEGVEKFVAVEIRRGTSKPDGPPRRCLDVSKARDVIGFEAKVNFREGLKRTVEWYKWERRINE